MLAIYRNLNRRDGTWYSVADRKSRRTIGKLREHVQPPLRCVGVEFVHPTAGAVRRVRSGPREVCMWLACEDVVPTSDVDLAGWVRVSCDPKAVDAFCVDGKPIDHAAECLLIGPALYVREDA